jgi:hypothetical protein
VTLAQLSPHTTASTERRTASHEWQVHTCVFPFTSKRRVYRQVSSALPFVPMSVESFGRLGTPPLTLFEDLADQAVQAGGPGLSRDAFITGALRELSAALCRGQASLCLSGACGSTQPSGNTPICGLARPSAEPLFRLQMKAS